MGSGKSCTVEERKVIYKLKQSGKKPGEIAKIMECSRKKVYNALALVEENSIFLEKNKIRKQRPRKTDLAMDRAIVVKSRGDPFKSAREICVEINADYGVNLSRRLVARRLNEASLFGRYIRRKPMLSKKNIAKRLHFAKTNKDKDPLFWRNVLWSDETKINRMGPDGKTFVRRPKGQALNPKYRMKSVKHGGGSIHCWGAFSWHGVCPIFRINGIMDRFQYLDILKNKMEPYAFENMPAKWTFMHDNDPKHSSKIVKKWL